MNRILCISAVVFFIFSSFAHGSFGRIPPFTETEYKEILTILEKEWYYPVEREHMLQCATPRLRAGVRTFADITALISACFTNDQYIGILPSPTQTTDTQTLVPMGSASIQVAAIPSGVGDVSFGNIAIERAIPPKADIDEHLFHFLTQLHGRHVTDFLIDLEGNIGGFSNGAAAFLAYFAPAPGLLFEARNRFGLVVGHEDVYVAGEKGMFADACIAVLVNKETASAAEIIAYDLQLWGAYIVGEPTYKKGIGQMSRNLQNGMRIRFTYGKIFFPDNTTTHMRGVMPNFITNDPHTAQEEAMKYLRTCHKKKEAAHAQ